MTDRKLQVGFSQRVRLEWLEAVATMAIDGCDKEAASEALQQILKDKVSVGGQAVRGNREKIITILTKTWLTVPDGLKGLRDDGLELLKQLPQEQHSAVHWGMVSAVYPFWASVAMQTGRLLRLQWTASAVHVQRRVREQYGERETVSRAARRVLRSFLDWGVLQESGSKGTYVSGSIRVIDEPKMVAWLVESSLHARSNGAAPLAELFDNPCLFPFKLTPVHADHLTAATSRLSVLRHGLNDELIALADTRVESANR